MVVESLPNLILVLTDGQGYPDLGCTGNPWLRTPQLDAFHAESFRLTVSESESVEKGIGS